MELLSKKRNIIVFLLLFIIIEIAFSFFLIPKLEEVSGEGMIDMEMFYNYESVYKKIDAYGEIGLEVYNKLQLIDLAFPLIYGLLFASIIYRLGSKYYFVSFIGALFDYMENGLIFLMLRKHPGEYHLLANICNVASLLKFLMFFVSIL